MVDRDTAEYDLRNYRVKPREVSNIPSLEPLLEPLLEEDDTWEEDAIVILSAFIIGCGVAMILAMLIFYLEGGQFSFTITG